MPQLGEIDKSRDRYPWCIVWTPIPLLTWFFPFIGHMGIALSSGIKRDFAGPYYVSEDKMAFGHPTKYWQLKLSLAALQDGIAVKLKPQIFTVTECTTYAAIIVIRMLQQPST